MAIKLIEPTATVGYLAMRMTPSSHINECERLGMTLTHSEHFDYDTLAHDEAAARTLAKRTKGLLGSWPVSRVVRVLVTILPPELHREGSHPQGQEES